MVHPAFEARRRDVKAALHKQHAAELYERLEPAWHAQASCRPEALGGEGPQRPGATWTAAFPDDVAVRDPDSYAPAKEQREFMALCAGCPVRTPCLQGALAAEAEPISLGDVWFYVSHEPRCDDLDCAGCVPAPERLRHKPFLSEPIPSGIFGGVPGRIRALYAEAECPTCSGRGCELGFMLDGVDVAVLAKGFKAHARLVGWPCKACSGTGRIRNPNQQAECEAWLTRECDRSGWTLYDQGKVAL